MRPLFFGLCTLACAAVLTAVMFTNPVLAQALDPGGSTIVDVGPATASLVEWLAPILLVVLIAGGSWLVVKLASLLGLKVNALQREVVEQGLERAIGYAITRVGDKAAAGIPIAVKSEAIAVATGYAANAIPGALKHFKKSRDDIAKMIEARLDGILIDPSIEASATIQPLAGISSAR